MTGLNIMQSGKLNRNLHCIILQDYSPDNTKAQSRLLSCDTSAHSFADSNKYPKHSCINFTFSPSTFELIYASSTPCSNQISLSSNHLHILYVSEYYSHSKMPWDEKQADVITSEISGPSGYTPVSLPLISVMLIPTYNHIPHLSDKLKLSGSPAMLCDKIWPWWNKWRETILWNSIFTFRIYHVRYFFNIYWELTSRKKGK